MHILFVVFLIVIAYLIGSIPSSVWIGKYFYGIDVREHGSGNAGTTNTFRVLGVKAGIPVFIIDVLKGWLAVYLIHISTYYTTDSRSYITIQVFLGVAALIGHIFPIYVGFKGGKGVATLLGVVLAIQPLAGLVAAVVFCIILLISRYVSLSSILAGFSFPIMTLIVFKAKDPALIIFSLLIFVVLLITHQKNIERLIRREESKVKIIKRKRKKKIN